VASVMDPDAIALARAASTEARRSSRMLLMGGAW
jgi:hypothetical protein